MVTTCTTGKGCIEAGLKFELLTTKEYVDVEVKGFGKGCIGGAVKYKNGDANPFSVNVSLDPVVVGINAVIKSKGYVEFSLVDWTYEYALTKEIVVYDSTRK